MKLVSAIAVLVCFTKQSHALEPWQAESSIREDTSKGEKADEADQTDQKGAGEASERLELAKLDMWSRGAFDWAEDEAMLSSALHLKQSPVSTVRRDVLNLKDNPHCDVTGYCSYSSYIANRFRGGEQMSQADHQLRLEQKIQELAARFGRPFMDAIAKNVRDHAEDCKRSCELYECISPDEVTAIPEMAGLLNETTVRSYSMGPVPPEDFAEQFGFPLDVIKVTETRPLFSDDEAAQVIQGAEAEGVDKNEFESGKYKLAGDWLINLPNTRQWFNSRLRTTFFPILANLFPEIVSSPSVLRAHSVSLLKYNSSHPRTDVHVDNGILALTVAMTPKVEYVGGGTYFEHMGVDNLLPMDVGHATFRPGSVRHGGHRVSDGTRYILGAFLLLEDRVEHVRRLKNRGSELRREQKLEEAAEHFKWALALNPKCTTCLKDWAEILHTQKNFTASESKIRLALQLLENKDSDALFTLGVLLSEQGRDEESIQAYQESVALNAEDAELCYNLGIKLGAKGKTKEEMQMYAKATKANPKFGGAWLNWGTALAEQGELDDAELMFLKALGCEADVIPKAMMNIGLLYMTKGNFYAQTGDFRAAKDSAINAAKYVDTAKPLLDHLEKSGKLEGPDGIGKYINQFKPLRLQCHKLLGQIHASLGNMEACEEEFRSATQSFPGEISAWQMLGRVLEMRGKTEEMDQVIETVRALR